MTESKFSVAWMIRQFFHHLTHYSFDDVLEFRIVLYGVSVIIHCSIELGVFLLALIFDVAVMVDKPRVLWRVAELRLEPIKFRTFFR